MNIENSQNKEFLLNPLKYIQDDFQKYLINLQEDQSVSIEQKMINYEKDGDFHKKLPELQKELEELKEELPLLNNCRNYKDLHKLNGKMVRYIGKTSDFESPEFYLRCLKVADNKVHYTKYSEVFPENLKPLEEGKSQFRANEFIGERIPTYTTSISNQSQWVNQHLYKTERQDEKVLEQEEKVFYYKNDQKNLEIGLDQDIDDLSNQLQKLQIFQPEQDSDIKSFPAILKVYGDELKVNEVVEAIGVLNISKPSQNENDDQYDVDFENFITQHPMYLVPRIHCFNIKPVSIDELVTKQILKKQVKKNNEKFIKTLFVNMMKDLCFGDELLAQYLILALISKPTLRKDGQILGHLPLNIRNCKQFFKFKEDEQIQYSKVFETVMQKLFAQTQVQEVSVKALNSQSIFYSEKNYSNNKMIPGSITTINRSLLILNELDIKPGKLAGKNGQGVKNYQFLKNLLDHQMQKLNFQVYETTLNTDIRSVVLSADCKSILDLKLVLALPQIEDKVYQSKNSLLKYLVGDEQNDNIEGLINSVRLLVMSLYDKYHLVKISPEVGELVGKDFVAVRTKDQTIDTDDLHRWLVLGKGLSCYINDGVDMTIKNYQDGKKLEKYRQVQEAKLAAQQKKKAEELQKIKEMEKEVIQEEAEEEDEDEEEQIEQNKEVSVDDENDLQLQQELLKVESEDEEDNQENVIEDEDDLQLQQELLQPEIEEVEEQNEIQEQVDEELKQLTQELLKVEIEDEDDEN